MTQIYAFSQGFEEFFSASQQFEHLVNRLRSKEAAQMEHGEIEDLVDQEGRELLRRLFQGYLDRRCSNEVQHEAIEGSDGLRPRHREECGRHLETLFGTVRVRREGYSAAGLSSLFPLDAELNLPVDQYSDGVRRRAVIESAKNSFEEAKESIEQTTGAHIAKRQIEQLPAKVAQDFEGFYQSRRFERSEETEDLLVMSFDSKGVVMRQEDLREATRKAAEREAHKLKTRLSPGEKPYRKRMARVATVYSIAPYTRSAEEIMGVFEAEEGKVKPRAENKRLWASLERSQERVIAEAFQEALTRDPHQQRPWVVLVDGEENQLERIEQAAEAQELPVTIILDLIHVFEYLWKAAYCFYPPGSAEAEEWVCQRVLEILRGCSSQVAGGMRRSATLRDLSLAQRQSVDQCADYLLKYRDYLHYDEYRWAGFPIATGVIEGACRHLVKDRMELTGARWGLTNAEAVLKLRALRSSGDFEEYWTFHKAQERQRNHFSRYARFPGEDDEELPLQNAA